MPQAFSDELVGRLARARRIGVLTGAGVSAESGIPTFRGEGGIWNRFKPEELANVDAFLRNPELVQKWYEHRRSIVLEKEPNRGHTALAELETMTNGVTIVTQNVDRLHHRAGSRNVVELHGNILRSYCIDCEHEATQDDLQPPADGKPSVCPDCGGFIRPDVVWFGEMLPAGAMERAHAAAERADVFLSIGTSAVVYPAAALPLRAADSGAYVAEINVEASAIAHEIDETVVGPAGEVLPALVDAVRRHPDFTSG
ncbi:MAG: NAD-dependent deacylase [Rhodothermales bacterium]